MPSLRPCAFRGITRRSPALLRLVATLGLCLVVLGPSFTFYGWAQDRPMAATAFEYFETGRTHLARGDSMAAHTVWRRGLEALTAEGAFDIRLADAYLRSVFRLARTDEQAAAADAYLQLIARGGAPGLSDAERRLVRRHVAQMVFLLPEKMQARVTPDAEALMNTGETLHPGAGEHLAAWWRHQDPLPASLGNERVVEHLERVAYAEKRFADERRLAEERRLARFDARGVIYVRLGAPSRVASLDNEAIKADGLGAFLSSTLSGPTVPPHTVWVYDELDEDALYLFVRRQHRYALGTVRDLLPPELRGPGYNQSETGRRRATLTIYALRDYYEQLYRLHPAYFGLLNQIETYLLRVSDRAFTTRLNAYSTLPPTSSPPGTEPLDPLSFAGRTVNTVRQTDRRLARRREETVPRARSETVDEDDRLPVAARTARFLEKDGTTRTEVYWAVDPADLTPSPAAQVRLMQQGRTLSENHQLQLTAVRYDADYRAQKKYRTEHAVPATSEEPGVYSLALPGGTGRYHLALQWDQYASSSTNEESIFIRTGGHRTDSLRALPSTPNTLAMSDLVPLRASDLADGEPVRDERGFRVTPYPFDTVTLDTELTLYVEAYHLTLGPENRTRYTVEYAVDQQRARDGVQGFFFGGQETETTAAATSHVGTSQTVREHVMLDLNPWEDASALQITVRIIDEHTGQQAERSVTFDLNER